jgi:hypothetical protein
MACGGNTAVRDVRRGSDARRKPYLPMDSDLWLSNFKPGFATEFKTTGKCDFRSGVGTARRVLLVAGAGSANPPSPPRWQAAPAGLA